MFVVWCDDVVWLGVNCIVEVGYVWFVDELVFLILLVMVG